MLGWYWRLPPRVRGWVPYVAGAAATMLCVGILGFGVGVESAPASSIRVRAPGSPAPSLGIVDLFVHNAGIAIRSALGLLSFGVYTTWVLLVNGFMLGAVLADAADANGIAWAVLGLLPHGIVEIPAFWLAGAVGFRWLAFAWKLANGDRDRIQGPWLFLESLAVVGLSIALLFVAAVIEATVTTQLV
jgi:stage II sporulation protein M